MSYRGGTFEGTGSPEGVVTAAVGSSYRRLDGAVGTTSYVKTSGTGNTGWTAIDNSGSELTSGYATVTTAQLNIASGTYADVTGWTTTITAPSRPITVLAWVSSFCYSDTAGIGCKYRLVRTDTSAVVAEQLAVASTAGQLFCSLAPLRTRLSLTAGSSYTFKVQVARVGASGNANFNATADAPLAIQVVSA